MIKKLRKRILTIILSFMVCFGFFITSIQANYEGKDGLDVMLTTEKDDYNEGDEIISCLTVTNLNSVTVNDIDLETFVPKGYTAKDGVTKKR